MVYQYLFILFSSFAFFFILLFHVWFHVKILILKNPQTDKHLQNSNVKWYCIKCFANIIPFLSFQIKSYLKLIKARKITFRAITNPAPREHSLIDELTSTIDSTDNDFASSKYSEPNEILPLINEQISSLSFFHLNISSLPYHFEKFSTILTENKLDFEFLEISESRIKLNRTPISSIQLLEYNLEYAPPDSSNGGTLVYIKKAYNTNVEKTLKY